MRVAIECRGWGWGGVMGREGIVGMGLVWVGLGWFGCWCESLFSNPILILDSWSTYEDGNIYRNRSQKTKAVCKQFLRKSPRYSALRRARRFLPSQNCIHGIAHLHGGQVMEEAIDELPAMSQWMRATKSNLVVPHLVLGWILSSSWQYWYTLSWKGSKVEEPNITSVCDLCKVSWESEMSVSP